MDSTSVDVSLLADRFNFGANWTRFLRLINDDRIREAEASLMRMLGNEALRGKSFLDIGCGSGLFSLAARRLGAAVRSFDYDARSVACAQELRTRYCPSDPQWLITQGSVLDETFVRSLRLFDIVYSWGVLHHTGDMWRALRMATVPLKRPGHLYIAIYNHQILWSRFYTSVKRTYVRAPAPGRALLAGSYIAVQVAKGLIRDVFSLQNPARRYREKIHQRGMSMWHDWIDWIGGYPFEVAKPEEVFDFLHASGLTLERLYTCGGGQGCNEFVFAAASEPPL